MGKKRKKSKGRERKRRRQKDAAAGAPSSPAEESPTEHEHDDNEPEAAEASDDEVGDDAAEPVDEVIDVEDDIDDPEARADLVAAAAALAEGALEDGDADGSEDGSGDESGEAEEELESPADDVEDGDVPLIRPDALIALSEFRDEGVATIPDELVLHLGEAASAEERDRVLAAALAHVEMQDAIYRVPLDSGTTRRWKGLLAAAIFVLALFLAGLPPSFLVPRAPLPLTTADRLLGIRTALLLQAEQVEAFQVREERLPTSLAEVETALPGIRFVRSSNRLYQLVAYTPEGEAVVYDSASPDPAFFEVTASWIAREDES